jgi:hypothetical protein
VEDYVKVSKEAFAPIVELVRIGLFRDEKDAIVGIIREYATNKIQYYREKINIQKKKYQVDFQGSRKHPSGANQL